MQQGIPIGSRVMFFQENGSAAKPFRQPRLKSWNVDFVQKGHAVSFVL